eukprot:SAG31_NODE_11838_length_993_cov_1.497763_1_plen_81_part_00
MDAWVKFENVVGDPPTPIVMIGDGSRSGSASLQVRNGAVLPHIVHAETNRALMIVEKFIQSACPREINVPRYWEWRLPFQ